MKTYDIKKDKSDDLFELKEINLAQHALNDDTLPLSELSVKLDKKAKQDWFLVRKHLSPSSGSQSKDSTYIRTIHVLLTCFAFHIAY